LDLDINSEPYELKSDDIIVRPHIFYFILFHLTSSQELSLAKILRGLSMPVYTASPRKIPTSLHAQNIININNTGISPMGSSWKSLGSHKVSPIAPSNCSPFTELEKTQESNYDMIYYTAPQLIVLCGKVHCYLSHRWSTVPSFMTNPSSTHPTMMDSIKKATVDRSSASN
jgi:hypothetical protein